MNPKRHNFFLFLFYLLILPPILSVFNYTLASSQAHDSTLPGPHPSISKEYRLPAVVDPDILSDVTTEIWAKIFYPEDINTIAGSMPIILMLHGNHGTCGSGSHPRYDFSCEYTASGKCPAGSVVVPNHEGYDYLAKNLASWGYWVVSINANRGITCGSGVKGDYGLNLARGRLVLKHLSLLYRWATVGDAPASIGLGPQGLIGKIDFSSVGLFGHSRGGEGVRAAYNLYNDTGSPWPAKIPGLSIKAIFEIGAVDGQTSRVLDANGTVWNQLIPLCDGDVSDLQGRYPFERMLLNSTEPSHAQKSLYEVWGANHNYFNTEWQTSDSDGCSVGKPIFVPEDFNSERQQKIALASVPAFFKSHLGANADPVFNQNFNPLNPLPNIVTDITQIDRDFTPSPGSTETLVIDDFDKKTGINSSGNLNLSGKIDIEHTYLVGSSHPQRAAELSWRIDGQETFFEAVIAGPAQGRDIHDFATLDFRVGRCSRSVKLTPQTDFSIQLEDVTGHLSKEVAVSDYVLINGPGNPREPMLATVRIPLSAFQGVDLRVIHGVRFTFNKTKVGKLYLANIRVHRQMGLGSSVDKTLSTTNRFRNTYGYKAAAKHSPPPPVYVPAHLNSMRIVRPRGLVEGKPNIEIVVASQRPFPAMNRLPVLKIGEHEFKLSRYSDLAHLKELTFTLTEEQYRRLGRNSEVSLEDGKIWQFGVLEKASTSFRN